MKFVSLRNEIRNGVIPDNADRFERTSNDINYLYFSFSRKPYEFTRDSLNMFSLSLSVYSDSKIGEFEASRNDGHFQEDPSLLRF